MSVVSNHGSIGLYALLLSYVHHVANRIFYCFCVTVVVGDQFLMCQHVIGIQAHGIGFLMVGAFVIRQLLLGYPVLSRYIGTIVV